MLAEFHALWQGWSGSILRIVHRHAESRFVGLQSLSKGQNTGAEIGCVVALQVVLVVPPLFFWQGGIEGTLTIDEEQSFPQQC